jgi:hypothetical protein
MTPHWTHSFAMRSRADKWFANGNSDIKYWFGADANELYMTGEPASGNITGKIAGNVLTAVTTPAYQQALTGGADDPLGVGFTDNSADSFDAANNTVHEFAAGSFCILSTYKITAGGIRTMLGKFAPWAGYVLYRNYGTDCFVYWNGSARTIAHAAAGTADYVMIFQNATAPEWGVLTGATGEHKYTSATLDVTNTRIFSLGSVVSALATGCVLGPTIIWTGADAETVIAARATTLPAWWAS